MVTENPIIDIPLIPSPKQQRQGRLTRVRQPQLRGQLTRQC